METQQIGIVCFWRKKNPTNLWNLFSVCVNQMDPRNWIENHCAKHSLLWFDSSVDDIWGVRLWLFGKSLLRQVYLKSLMGTFKIDQDLVLFIQVGEFQVILLSATGLYIKGKCMASSQFNYCRYLAEETCH